ncbi:MAG: F0F1 ATP synthase subunit gamma [Gammaproteobacteria bacterium]|nr:F0F1 ATP synthase subunit gamma [Gammaproteobacteria bacterium]
MKQYSKLVGHLNTLRNIRSIITAMKNLALIEESKIGGFLVEQKKVVASIENIAADFFHFYPEFLQNMSHDKIEVCILLGSERGFCGKFNEQIIKAHNECATQDKARDIKVVVVGSKLANKIEGTMSVFKQIEGPSSSEEMAGIILKLVKNLEDIYPTNWVIVCNEEIENRISSKIIRPFSDILTFDKKKYAVPMHLNLKPDRFFANLLDEYLLALLYKIFYNSFLLENKQRSQHMDGALQWLDKEHEELTHDLNSLRQAEIIEDIEEIMLNVDMVLKEDIV